MITNTLAGQDSEILVDDIVRGEQCEISKSAEINPIAAIVVGVPPSPIKYDGAGGVFLNHANMVIDHPYRFTFEDNPLWAVKDREGTITVYYVQD